MWGRCCWLFERDADGQAGNELATVSYADMGSLIGNTGAVTQFSQIDIDPATLSIDQSEGVLSVDFAALGKDALGKDEIGKDARGSGAVRLA